MISGQRNKGFLLLGVSLLILLMPLLIYIPIDIIKSSQENLIENIGRGDSRLTKIILSRSDYNRVNPNNENEIQLNNMLYDIKSVSKSGSDYILEVLEDDKETQWNEIKERIICTDQQKTEVKNFVFMFFFYENLSPFQFQNQEKDLALNIETTPFWIAYYETVPTPPPDVYFS